MQAALHEYEVNEQDGLAVQRSRNPLGTGDSNGDIFAVALRSAGGGYSSLLGVTVKGEVIRADGQTVYLTGSVSSYYATVTLSPACYAVPGDLELTIKLSAGSMTRSVLRVKLDVIACTTEILATYSEGGGSIADLTGAVRYDAAQNLSDAQKAQARANIGVTSTGADISGLIDDDIANTTTSGEQVWSSRKTSIRIQLVEKSANDKIGDFDTLDVNADNLVDAINIVNQKAASGGGTGNIPTHVNARGDSLTLGAGTTDANEDGYSDYDTHSYPALLAKKINMPVYNYGVGGETVATILGREGSVPMVVDSLYISGSATRVFFPPETIKSITGEEAKPLLQRARIADVNPCYIAGIKGTLDYDPGNETSDPMYSFAREEPGEAVQLRGPVIIETQQMRKLEPGQLLLLWMGHNNIETDLDNDVDAFADYLIERHKTAIEHERPAGYIILSAPVTNKTASSAEKYKPIYERMQAVFGIHYLNIVDYLINSGVYDAQAYDNSIEMTDGIIQDMAAYRIPSVLRAPDGVHLNGMGYQLVADQVYKRGQLLGYWT